MGRLIDADELLQDIRENMPNYEVKGEFLNYVNEQPTAYEVEKVVAELEEWTFETDVTMPFDKTIMKNQKLIASGNAIDIVRRGGVE